MKKFIAMLTSVVMLMTALCSAAFASFSDVDDTNPYKKAITTLSTLNVISGYDDGTFAPDKVISRAEFTSLIVHMLGFENMTSEENSFDDLSDDHWAKNYIQTAYGLGIISGMGDGTFEADSPVTYEQALKMIVCTLGYEGFAQAVADANNGWADGYIKQANSLEITKGVADAEYSSGASRGVVAQVLYNALEVEMYENNGYQYVKTEKTLLKDYLKCIEFKGTLVGVADYVTEDCTQSLYEYEMAVITNSGDYVTILFEEYISDEFEKTDTAQNYNKSTNEKRQTIKDYTIKINNSETSDEDKKTYRSKIETLESEIKKLENEKLEAFKLFANDTTIKELRSLLGTTIIVFYKQLSENDEKTLVIFSSDSSKNTQIELTHDDIRSLDGTSLKYYVSSTKSETVKLKEDELTVRYNGRLVSSGDTVTLTNPSTKETEEFSRQEALEQWLNPDTDYTIYGTATLTDSSSDGTIDMVQIYDYDVMVAYAAPTTSDYRITDKLVTGNYLVLDPQAASYTYTITKDGSEIAVTSIKANDVILYATSLDKSMYTLLVSSESVKGSVSSINTNSGQLTISNTAYNIGDTFETYIKEKDGRELKVGVSGTFYTDSFGTLVFGTLDAATVVPYAYIADAYVDYDEGGKTYITAFLSSSTSTAASYQLDDKVKLNGSSVKAELVVDRLAESAAYSNNDSDYAEDIYGAGKEPENLTYSQPARITVKDNKVTEIITLTSEEAQTSNDDAEQLVLCKELNQYTYSSNSFTKDGKSAFSVNSSTIVITVPSDRKTKKLYTKKALSSIFTSGDSYYVEAYDVNSSKIAGLVIVYGNDGSLTRVKKDTDFSVVASLPESVYSEVKDDTVLQFNVFAGSSNTAKSWTTYDSKEFASVQVGDVVQFAYDSDNLAQGRINCITMEDITEILDGGEADGQKFNWAVTQTPDEDNNYQKYKFDYRFKQSGTEDDEIYYSTSLGSIPYSRACMYNVSQVLVDDKKLYVTKDGFTADDDGIYVLDDSDYEEITITSSTKILRMEDDREEISRYAADTTTDMSISDLRDAKNYGVDCSKILVCSLKGTAKLIVVYN